MTTNKTHISILLDRSASMVSTWKDVLVNFAKFLAEQREIPGVATLSLFVFDDQFDEVISRGNIMNIDEKILESYTPRGSTALWDSIARTVSATKSQLSALSKEDAPDNVIFVIITDGGENCSKEIRSIDSVKSIMTSAEKDDKWDIVYLGANLDASAESSKLGIGKSANWSNANYGNAMDYVSAKIGSTRLGMSSLTGAINTLSNVDSHEAKDVYKMYKRAAASKGKVI